MTGPAPERWSVKDHLIHLATWECLIVAHVRFANDHELLDLDQRCYEAMDALTLNAHTYQRTSELPLTRVLGEYQRSHAAMLQLLDHLPHDDLHRPYWRDGSTGHTALEKIAGDSYLHYLEHRRWILELLARLNAE